MSKKFVLRSLLFIALLLLVNVMLDQSFKAFSVHNILNKRMDEQFAGYTDTLKYLSMGNSHNCVNTYLLEKSFNYGSPSENYIQSYYKLKHILEHSGKKPEYLLLQADISTYGAKIANRYEYNSYWIKYIDYPELARIKNDRQVLTKWLEGKFFSYAGNYKDVQLSIVYRIKIKTLEMHNGFRPHRDYRNFAQEPNRQQLAWDKAQLFSTPGVYFDPTIKAYFKKILQLCDDYEIKVYLIRYPVSQEFYTEETRIVPAWKLYPEVERIASGYTSYLGTLDYHNLFFDHPEYFFDPDHLNIKGSDLFTLKLADDLRLLSR
ncbi:MAG: hypothetical protein KUL83_00440 [Lentimicrobium sp.]|jgi:hypothetical protein|nr:hypothetical protein [Lentimicrobium sp.]MDD2529211.1 hypothetical protein [Lentimicrobiaceae bacterium]MDD4596673.1 hypothetical protein [Lentimicrobiaceae bacterium]MDY0024906.1 hypothetical protein [Lentimicrobium sp.]